MGRAMSGDEGICPWCFHALADHPQPHLHPCQSILARYVPCRKCRHIAYEHASTNPFTGGHPCTAIVGRYPKGGPVFCECDDYQE